MNAVAFDTHKAVKRLKEAGVTETQAEAFVETFGGAFNDHVATKDDLALFRGDLTARIDTQSKDLTAKIEAQGKELRGEIREMEQRMMIKLGGLMVAGVVFLSVLNRLFPIGG